MNNNSVILDKNLFKILLGPHISEKSSLSSERFSTIIIKVNINSNKLEIKRAIQALFNISVSNINTVIVKGKKKRKKNHIAYFNNWKKAYITLKKGQNLNFIGNM